MEKAVLPLSPHSHILLMLRKGLGRVSAYMVLDTHTLGVIVRKLQQFAVLIILHCTFYYRLKELISNLKDETI